jgi:hypothetical protein
LDSAAPVPTRIRAPGDATAFRLSLCAAIVPVTVSPPDAVVSLRLSLVCAVDPTRVALPVAAVILRLHFGVAAVPAIATAPAVAASVCCCACDWVSSRSSNRYSSVKASMIDTEPTEATAPCLNSSPVFSRTASFCP